MKEEMYQFMKKSPEELAKEANKLLKSSTKKEMTPEEEIEDDAEGGYYQTNEN